MMTDSRSVGQIVDDLGCGLDGVLHDGDLVASAIVILKAVTEEGGERLITMRSETLGVAESTGLLTLALDEARFANYDGFDAQD